MTGKALFSIVTPVRDASLESLTATAESVLAQTNRDWELLLVGGWSEGAPAVAALTSLAARNSRIRVLASSGEDVVSAWNDAVRAAHGEFIGLLDHGDMLSSDALAQNSAHIEVDDGLDYVYSDEDVLGPDGRCTQRFCKPEWSPERLRSQNYCNNLSILRASVVRDVGGFRSGFDGSEVHDLLLRVTERARRVMHIADVLYHRRATPGSSVDGNGIIPGATDGGRRAIQEHLDRMKIRGTAEVAGPGHYRTRRVLPPERRVSIVIPTRGSDAVVWGRRVNLVCSAVRSALTATRHENLEIVVVYDQPTPESVLAELRDIAGEKLVLVPFDEPFNYSRKMNLGVLASSGDRLVLLNDDVKVRSDGWVEELLAPLEQGDVGMTGAKLYFSSTAIQHAGLAFSNGRYVHPYRRAPEDTTGAALSLLVDREVSGVTGACVGLRREVYIEVGGMTELLKESFNDVDFSYKVSRAGYRILFLAHCELFHFESQTRDPAPDPDDDRFVRSRWGIPRRDPFLPVYPDLPAWADRNVNLRRAPRRSVSSS